MLTVEGIFDGQKVEIFETIPFKRKIRVLVTFLDDSTVQTELTTESDPLKALRGRAKHAHLTEKLLESRREDLTLEDTKLCKANNQGGTRKNGISSQIKYRIYRQMAYL